MKTLKVTLDYGRTGLPVELPAERVVGPLTIGDVTPLEDPEKAVAAAIETPIGTPPLRRDCPGSQERLYPRLRHHPAGAQSHDPGPHAEGLA